MQPRHRVAVGAEPDTVLGQVVAGENQRQRLDIGRLALIARAQSLRLIKQGAALTQVGCGGWAVGIGKQAKRLTPVRHRAARVRPAGLTECLACGLVPERVLQQHAAVEGGLRLVAALHRKADAAEHAGSGAVRGVVMSALRHRRRWGKG
ncbi:hypothetical protein ACFQU2_41855 [Siccirubricoccus deserti]